ncbi:MAG: hypothetical protein AB8B65_19585 [Kordia sp.]|uniref:hypothetical protein n=1 Tax=Kordia sp. TaxID=1965332 RepID=UPI00385B1419
MKKYINLKIGVLFLFLSLLGCSKHTEFLVKANDINLKYKDSNTIESPILKLIEIEYGEKYQIAYKTRNDTTFLVPSDGEKKFYGMNPYRRGIKLKTSTLNCDEKIRIDAGRFSFYFCYSDTKKIINELANMDDVACKFYYSKIKDSMLNLKQSKNTKTTEFATDQLISILLRNINFEIKDTGNEDITEVRVGDIFTGWSGMYEHFLVNSKKDTIATFSFTQWVH